ncbi:conserved hypothetical protein [Burkholderia pseudomallei 576]|nr:conserved hypothetical protein [Burkholderia pseudomallei 576]
MTRANSRRRSGKPTSKRAPAHCRYAKPATMRRAQTLGLHTAAIPRELGYDGGRIAMIAREAHPVDRFTRTAGFRTRVRAATRKRPQQATMPDGHEKTGSITQPAHKRTDDRARASAPMAAPVAHPFAENGDFGPLATTRGRVTRRSP